MSLSQDRKRLFLFFDIYGQGIDEPIQVTRHTTQVTSYYIFDGLGSVTELTDASQGVVESYKYDAFGNLTILDSSLVPRREFLYLHRQGIRPGNQPLFLQSEVL